MAVNPIPPAHAAVTPYLIVNDATRALEFYKQAFGAVETMRFDAPGGKIAHAEIRIGAGGVMLADEMESHRGPLSLGGTPVSMMFYVANVDTVFARAIAAGAKAMRPVVDQFYGDRSGTLVDPFGHVWTISTQLRQMSAAEMQQAMEAMMQKESKA
jgi:PhnB protein